MKHINVDHEKLSRKYNGVDVIARERVRHQKRNEERKERMAKLTSEKLRLTTFLLAWFLGIFGIHRFYVGKIGTGILWLITFGWFGIGATIDAVMALSGEFKDAEGRSILKWINKENKTLEK